MFLRQIFDEKHIVINIKQGNDVVYKDMPDISCRGRQESGCVGNQLAGAVRNGGCAGHRLAEAVRNGGCAGHQLVGAVRNGGCAGHQLARAVRSGGCACHQLAEAVRDGGYSGHQLAKPSGMEAALVKSLRKQNFSTILIVFLSLI